ncbi:ribosomal protein S5 domain 2-like protein [Tilletiaria anomala UBC 951]|uniref:Ribosomal RNA-processing protein 43 n=1 Tax=Tilletiaria anomala (strain ATCC 24038 / CBS 436.72 / UBC 951) TaxID=1037660 RepID=A0A066VH29_TILAU|nr:ribosomal protein S5 domain 2-like protein [Tilletiaria anomala UBC 951]KDN39618.1 ribosomal protein S5 domain 2-like protein [Tilletiaria anomala UBC 951]
MASTSTIPNAGATTGTSSLSLDLSTATFKRLHPRTYLERFLTSHIREDGRLFSTWRPTSAVMGAISSAEGSCLVRMGVTTVVAGIKAEVAKPDIARSTTSSHSSGTAAKASAGWLVPNIEISPLSSARGRPGPPTEEGQLLCDRLTDLLASPSRPVIDVTSLCIQPGVAAWCLYLDITVVSNDGNVLDAAMLAAIGALMDTRLPKATFHERTNRVICSDDPANSAPLPLLSLPFSSSFGIYEGAHLLSDPSSFEAAFTASSHIVVGLSEWTEEGSTWARAVASFENDSEAQDGAQHSMDTDEDFKGDEGLNHLAITYLHQVGRCRALLPPDELQGPANREQPSALLTPLQVITSCLAKAKRRYAELKGVLETARSEAHSKRIEEQKAGVRTSDE